MSQKFWHNIQLYYYLKNIKYYVIDYNSEKRKEKMEKYYINYWFKRNK